MRLQSALLRRLQWSVLAVAAGLTAVNAPLVLIGGVASLMAGLALALTPLAPLAVTLIVAPLRTLIATESALQLPLDVGQIAFLALIGIWYGIRLMQRRKIAFTLTPILAAMLGLTIILGLTSFSALSMSFWFTEWLKWVTIVMLVLLIGDIASQRRWETIVAVLVAAGAGNALIGLYIFFGGSGADHLLISGRFFRAFGTFGQPNPFGGFMGLLLPLALMAGYGYLLQGWRLWQLKREIRLRALIITSYYGITSLLLLAGLITSWSRGAWLGFVVSGAVIAFALPRKFWQSLLLASSVIGVIALLWLGGLLPQSVTERITSSAEDYLAFRDVRGVDITTINYAVVERFAHWQAAINMTQENPWLGVGFGNYEVAYEQYRLVNWDEALGHAHNYYLNILAEAGMIGALSYLAFWLIVVICTWQIRSHPDVLVRSMGVGLMGSWAYLAVHSLLDNLYVNNLFLHLGVMLGLASFFFLQTRQSIQWG